jgi:hypothetical protein
VQAFPQEPQFSGSDWKLTHAVRPPPTPHGLGVGSTQGTAVARHTPARHFCPVVQPVPHVPTVFEQNAGSDAVSTQLPPHKVSPGRHLQAPALQYSPSLQMPLAAPPPAAQRPQLRASFCRSRQPPPPPPPNAKHAVSPVSHWQVPRVQPVVNSGSQALPQKPQFAVSDAVLTQVPLQLTVPVGHTQTLFVQTLPPPQLVLERHATQVDVVGLQ